jgi:hypothetical protein
MSVINTSVENSTSKEPWNIDVLFNFRKRSMPRSTSAKVTLVIDARRSMEQDTEQDIDKELTSMTAGTNKAKSAAIENWT